MGVIMDDLAVAFVMRCDGDGLTYEEGMGMAEALCDEIMMAAEDRYYAVHEDDEED
jgi:ribosomal protein S7